MTDKQPDALRLADWLEADSCDLQPPMDAAAELRRLHQFAEDQIGRASAAEAALQMTKSTYALKMAAVEAQRDALLEVLRGWLSVTDGQSGLYGFMEPQRAASRAVIAKVKGEKA